MYIIEWTTNYLQTTDSDVRQVFAYLKSVRGQEAVLRVEQKVQNIYHQYRIIDAICHDVSEFIPSEYQVFDVW